jgi:phosphate starvation-inducible PhoH-like protein
MAKRIVSKRNSRKNEKLDELEELEEPVEKANPLAKFRKNKSFKFIPKNKSQKKFVEEIEKNNIVFNIGSAGVGKSFCAVCWAFEALTDKSSKYKKLIFTRPAIEACGERIGFLPGGLEAKLSPYMQPIYDILFRYGIHKNDIELLIEKGIIEICPLAFMRGRSLENILLIAEEIQNINSDQMEMLLTRIGTGSKFILTGDTSQRDIKRAYGVEEALQLFGKSDKISFVTFDRSETLRDPMVEFVVEKYAKLRDDQLKNNS